MAKKPADQTSTNGANGAGDAVDLEVDLDGTEGGGADSDDEDDDDDDEDDSDKAGASNTQAIIDKAVTKALAAAQKQFQSEMDRRINSALAKGAKKPAPKDDDEDEGAKPERQAAPAADVRGARLAFREYLPESIKLVSTEEKALANEFGQNLIRARALNGFDDEDQTGREVADLTAAFLKKARDLYSSRTKRILQKQGALIEQADGRGTGGDAPPSSVASAYDAALKKDMQLFPERYKDQLQK